jgi:hypothetical protein
MLTITSDDNSAVMCDLDAIDLLAGLEGGGALISMSLALVGDEGSAAAISFSIVSQKDGKRQISINLEGGGALDLLVPQCVDRNLSFSVLLRDDREGNSSCAFISSRLRALSANGIGVLESALHAGRPPAQPFQ